MVTGSSAGHIALWNLETKKLHSYVKEAHYASVTGLVCLPSEPLMVTSSADNSLKVSIIAFLPVSSGCILIIFVYVFHNGNS